MFFFGNFSTINGYPISDGRAMIVILKGEFGNMAITNPGVTPVWNSFVSGAAIIVKMHNAVTVTWTLPETC